MIRILFTILATALLATSAWADTYPIDGRWGVTTSTEKGPIDCGRLRVITFSGNQRFDTGGGVPSYRNKQVRNNGATDFRVTDVFSTGQINNAEARFTLKIVEPDRVEMNLQPGGMLKLRKCK